MDHPSAAYDNGCICPLHCRAEFGDAPSITQPIPECYGIDGNMFLDPAYNPLTHMCSSVETTHSTANASTFLE